MENIYSELNYSIINFIGAARSANDFRALKQLGVSDKQIDRLSKMPFDQLQRFKSMRTPIAQVSIDPRHFDLCMDYIVTEATVDDIKNQMIVMDASAAMLAELTGMDPSEYRTRRQRLGLEKASQGRPASLNEHESIIVGQSWSKFSDEPDLLKRYFNVGIDTQIALNRVWAFMQLEQ